MKLKVLQEDFSKAVSQVSRFVNPRVQLPILGNIVLKASKTNLSLLATNLELSISRQVGAKVEAEGEIAIPGKVISEIIVNLPKGQILLESEKEQLKLKAESFNGLLSGINTTDFPRVISSIGKENVLFEAKQIVNALSKVSFCTSVDETRPVLSGVLFIFKKKELILVSTDGFRLSQKTIPLTKETSLEKVILPKSAIMELLRSAEESQQIQMEVRPKENQVVFGVGESVLSTRIISGDFPNFEAIIPKNTLTKTTTSKEDLLRVVKIASVFARDNANMIKLEIGKDSLKISAESPKSGKQEANIEAKTEGEELEIIFNYRFLEELLNIIEGEDVEIELTNTTSPGVFRDPKDPNFLHLIMPVKVQG